MFRLYLLGLLILIGACNTSNSDTSSATSSKPTGKLVHVYSTRGQAVDSLLYQQFEAATGIQVVLTVGDEKFLWNRLEGQGEVDVLVSWDVAFLERAVQHELLQPIKKEFLDEHVPLAYRQANRFWFGLGYRGHLLAYNPAISIEELENYEDLAQEKWASQLAYANNQTFLAAMIANRGEENTLTWLQALAKHQTIKGIENDFRALEAVEKGWANIALVKSSALANYWHENPTVQQKMAVHLPNQKTSGVHVNLSGAGVVHNAKNLNHAVQLLIFLTGEEAQEILTNQGFEYPINPGATPNILLQSWGDFQKDPLDFTFLYQNQKKAKELQGLVD